MGRSLKLTGTGCRSVIRNTLHRCLASASSMARLSVNAPFLDARGPHRRITACGTILTSRTGEIVFGSWRSTPPHFLNLRGAGVRSHLGASGTEITSQTNASSGRNTKADRQPYNTALRPAGFR